MLQEKVNVFPEGPVVSASAFRPRSFKCNFSPLWCKAARHCVQRDRAASRLYLQQAAAGPRASCPLAHWIMLGLWTPALKGGLSSKGNFVFMSLMTKDTELCRVFTGKAECKAPEHRRAGPRRSLSNWGLEFPRAVFKEFLV